MLFFIGLMGVAAVTGVLMADFDTEDETDAADIPDTDTPDIPAMGGNLFSQDTQPDQIPADTDDNSHSAQDDVAETLSGGNSNDVIWGGPDTDIISGNAGADLLHGEYGADQLDGGDGSDTLFGHFGADTLTGGAGDDTAHGGQGDDLLTGGTGNDALHGNDGDDQLHGGNGEDVLFGGTGHDAIHGDDDYVSDFLNGGTGSDSLFAGHQDVVTTGEGADQVFLAASDEAPVDVELVDFNPEEDRLAIIWSGSDGPPSLSVTPSGMTENAQIVSLDGQVAFRLTGAPALSEANFMLIRDTN